MGGKISIHKWSRQIRSAIGCLILLAAALSVSLLAVEFLLRLATKKEYYIWPPNLRRTYHPDPKYLPGVSGPGRLLINSLGLRGDELPSDAKLRILTLGGSTTEALYLDQQESWPYVFQNMLNTDEVFPKAWVGNGGKSGHHALNHIYQVRHLVPQIPDLQYVTVLCGINETFSQSDWVTEFKSQPLPEPEVSEIQILGASFSEFPLPVNAPIWGHWRDTAFRFRLGRLYGGLNKMGYLQDHQGKFHDKMRHLYQRAQLHEKRPDLTFALRTYERKLDAIVDAARDNNVNLIFMTQPYLYHPNLSAEEKKLLWFGFMWDSPIILDYYSPDVMAWILDSYNQTMLDTCKRTHTGCIDLASALPHAAKYFYDDVHLNEQGNQEVAKAVYAYFKEKTSVPATFTQSSQRQIE